MTPAARGPALNQRVRDIRPVPMRMARLDAAYARLLGPLSLSAARAPSMMSLLEKRVLFGLARDVYSGAGIICDAGTFLGASTVCFGEGLRRNPAAATIRARWPRPIVAFERGLINPGMPAFFQRHRITGMGDLGESFVPALERTIAGVADAVDLRIGDIQITAAGDDTPIEILFLDVLKLPEISAFAVQNLFPRLIPGVSIVVQQDYFYDMLPYIKTDQEFFAAHFDYIGEACSSALFRCRAAITPDAIATWQAGIPPRQQERLAGIAMQRSVDPARRFMMGLSKVRLLCGLYGGDVGRDYLRHLLRDFPDQATTTQARLHEAIAGARQACDEDPAG